MADAVGLMYEEELRKFKWQPIETAPKDGTDILVLLWDRECCVVSYESDASDADYPWMTLDGSSYHLNAPTYWMPLPELPFKKERNENAS